MSLARGPFPALGQLKLSSKRLMESTCPQLAPLHLRQYRQLLVSPLSGPIPPDPVHPPQGTNVKLIVSSLSCPPPFREHPSSPHRAQPSGPSIEREMQIRADQGAPAAVGQGGAGPRMSRTGLPAGVGSRGPTIQLGPGYIPEIAAPFFLPNSDKIGIFGTHRVCETNP